MELQITCTWVYFRSKLDVISQRLTNAILLFSFSGIRCLRRALPCSFRLLDDDTTGEIPGSLAELNQLEELDLGTNQLTGEMQ